MLMTDGDDDCDNDCDDNCAMAERGVMGLECITCIMIVIWCDDQVGAMMITMIMIMITVIIMLMIIAIMMVWII